MATIGRDDPDGPEWDDDPDDVDDDDDERDHDFVTVSRDLPRLLSPWRLAVATALSGLATWLGVAGPNPFATAAAVAAGAILLVVG